jgi:hypothetical protein
MIENANTDISSLSSIHAGKKDNKIICERITEVKEPSSLIKAISEVLKDTCEQSQLNKNEKLILIKPFMTKKRLNFSIYEYLNHLYKYSQASEEIFIIMLIYIDRLKTNRKICLNYFNIYKLILASFVTAIKFNSDEYYPLEYYAKSGGISQKEMATLEYEFISLLDFKLFVDQKLFDKYLKYLREAEQNEDDDIDYDSDD